MDNFENLEWEETLPPPDDVSELKQIRKSLRKRNIFTIGTCFLLAAALILGAMCVERTIWNPNQNSYGIEFFTDLEFALAAYSELFSPSQTVYNVNTDHTGFGTYSISVEMWENYTFRDITYRYATARMGQLEFSDGFWSYNSVNIFDRATYPFYDQDEEFDRNTLQRLQELPSYIQVLAAVSFPEDLSMEQLIQLNDSLEDGGILWVGIRNSPTDEQRLPLCGMKPFAGGVVMDELNEYYPAFDIKTDQITPELLEDHFQALLTYSRDFIVSSGFEEPAPVLGTYYYDETLAYIEENGVSSYGAYIIASPQTFLDLWNNGTASQIWMRDAWIDLNA